MSISYRRDIDGLRAIAVIAVILYHLEFLTNGYLGVDIFFVISGYLITSIVNNEVLDNKFSIRRFYERRIRRILPLLLFTTLISLLLGLCFMLPDDLENLSQSVVASNFSANNILMWITSRSYWSIQNDYKPLMHTWSLGIEEQFYLLYPLIFVILGGKRQKYILPVLIFLTAISLALFFRSHYASSKFYFLEYRFFELAFGGICAIFFREKKAWLSGLKTEMALFILLFFMAFLLLFGLGLDNDYKILSIDLLAAGIIVLGGYNLQEGGAYLQLMANQTMRFIGKISFSLYLWHQVVFAFARYIFLPEISFSDAIALTAIVFLLSVLSYHFVENPYRDKKTVKTKPMLAILGASFLLITGLSFYIYTIGGIVRDVPQLGLNTSSMPGKLNFFNKDNINICYNEKICKLDRDFQGRGKKKVLVMGNSFGRDFSNILLESRFKDSILLSYYSYNRTQPNNSILSRIKEADFIFFANDLPFTLHDFDSLKKLYRLDSNKVWVVGLKDFGYSNGIYYNLTRSKECVFERTFMKRGILEKNNLLQRLWGTRYINLINCIGDTSGMVMVFTPEGRFISQDTEHFTEDGAKYFSRLLEDRLSGILGLKLPVGQVQLPAITQLHKDRQSKAFYSSIIGTPLNAAKE